jgi:uncharacterized protein (TIGR00251 family)
MTPQAPGTQDGLAFWIHVTPRARRRGVGGSHADALRVAVASPASEGRANEDCRAALADAFAVPRRAVSLRSGERSRRKQVWISGDPARLERRLAELAMGAGVG